MATSNVVTASGRAAFGFARLATHNTHSARPDVIRFANSDTTPRSAGLARRLAAMSYDALLLGALLFCFTLALLAARGGREVAPGTVWFELCLVGIAFVFFGGFWTHGGQTLGMRAWRLRLVAVDGGAIDWSRAAVRFAAAALSLAPLGLGYWWAWLDRDRRCWHDRLSGTTVVRIDLSAPAPTRST
jgi:uncharacterized RDD family membrane protein YckC